MQIELNDEHLDLAFAKSFAELRAKFRKYGEVTFDHYKLDIED